MFEVVVLQDGTVYAVFLAQLERHEDTASILSCDFAFEDEAMPRNGNAPRLPRISLRFVCFI